MIIDPEKEPNGIIFILLRNDNKVLLMQRDGNSKYYPYTWTFPGGACDDGEAFLDACIREADEEFEAKLHPNDCTLIMKRINNHNWVYVCTVSDNTELRQHEGADMAWKSVAELQDLELGYEQEDIIPVLADFIDRQ